MARAKIKAAIRAATHSRARAVPVPEPKIKTTSRSISHHKRVNYAPLLPKVQKVFYQILASSNDEKVPVAAPVNPRDPYTGSIDTVLLSKPITASSLKVFIAAVNGIAHHCVGDLILSINDTGSVADDRILNTERDSTIDFPVILIMDRPNSGSSPSSSPQSSIYGGSLFKSIYESTTTFGEASLYGASIASIPFGYAGGKLIEAVGGALIKGYQTILISRAFYHVRRMFPMSSERITGLEDAVDNLLEFARDDVHPPYPDSYTSTCQRLVVEQCALNPSIFSCIQNDSLQAHVITNAFQVRIYRVPELLSAFPKGSPIWDCEVPACVRNAFMSILHRTITNHAIALDSTSPFTYATVDNLLEYHFDSKSRSLLEHLQVLRWLLCTAPRLIPIHLPVAPTLSRLNDSIISLVAAIIEIHPPLHGRQILPFYLVQNAAREIASRVHVTNLAVISTHQHPLSRFLPIEFFTKMELLRLRLLGDNLGSTTRMSVRKAMLDLREMIREIVPTYSGPDADHISQEMQDIAELAGQVE